MYNFGVQRSLHGSCRLYHVYGLGKPGGNETQKGLCILLLPLFLLVCVTLPCVLSQSYSDWVVKPLAFWDWNSSRHAVYKKSIPKLSHWESLSTTRIYALFTCICFSLKYYKCFICSIIQFQVLFVIFFFPNCFKISKWDKCCHSKEIITIIISPWKTGLYFTSVSIHKVSVVKRKWCKLTCSIW